mgnify:CR=1 FL=1
MLFRSRHGIHTYSTEQIAVKLLDLCTAESRAEAVEHPLDVDLTGGLGNDTYVLALGDDKDRIVEAAAGDILAVRAPPAERAAVEGLAAGAAVTLQVRLRGPGVHTLVPGTLVAD